MEDMTDIELARMEVASPPIPPLNADPSGRSSEASPEPTPTSHSDQSESHIDEKPAYLRENPALLRSDPWQPIVLSLDGGGIRGLSSLYVLQQLMHKIEAEEKRLDEAQEANPDSSEVRPALTLASSSQLQSEATRQNAGEDIQDRRPCHYFDFMVGTSTGGLIAVLLGRLRLDVDTCIKVYEELGTYIFGHWRWWRLTKYDHKRLEDAMKVVLKRYCREHHETDKVGCEGEDLMRQYDFSHLDGIFKNNSCKVALMALREGDRKRGEGDKRHLFRSYDHVEAPPTRYNLPDATELNPGRVQSNPTMIWEACRATSAAPLYFDKMMLGGVRYMDGGVGQNNPAEYALNEAHQMCAGGDQTENVAAALISVGTGHKKPQSRFQNILHIMKWARKSITDTEEAHVSVGTICKGLKIPYFRFDVKTGLSEMKLDECKKERARKKSKNTAQANGNVTGAVPAPAAPVPVQASEEPLFDSYQPTKYDYITYNTIKDCTLNYCQHKGGGYNNPVDVDRELTNAAELLVYYRRKREASSRQEWDNFSTHPYVRVNRLLNGLNRESSFPARAQP